MWTPEIKSWFDFAVTPPIDSLLQTYLVSTSGSRICVVTNSAGEGSANPMSTKDEQGASILGKRGAQTKRTTFHTLENGDIVDTFRKTASEGANTKCATFHTLENGDTVNTFKNAATKAANTKQALHKTQNTILYPHARKYQEKKAEDLWSLEQKAAALNGNNEHLSGKIAHLTALTATLVSKTERASVDHWRNNNFMNVGVFEHAALLLIPQDKWLLIVIASQFHVQLR
ncbi:hypothetical protein JCM16303_001722 [Sporobolomyces ruberrimus]